MDVYLIILLVLLQSEMCRCQVAQYREEVNSIKFEGVNLLHKTVRNVWHMEVDEFIQGNVVYSVERQLRSVSIPDANITVIAGSVSQRGHREGTGEHALFLNITSFTQLYNSTMLVVDSGNYCLRYVDRQTDNTSTAVGMCGSQAESDSDGNFTSTRFLSKPESLTKRSDNLLLLTLADSFSIKQINLTDSNVSIIISIPSTFALPVRITIAPQTCDIVYITTKVNILRADLKTGEVSSLNPSRQSGESDGPLSLTTFKSLHGAEVLSIDTLVIADTGNGVLRVIDLNYNTTSAVCRYGGPHIRLNNGPITSCTMFRPFSMLHLKHKAQLLVGTAFAIRIINLKYLSPSATEVDPVLCPTEESTHLVQSSTPFMNTSTDNYTTSTNVSSSETTSVPHLISYLNVILIVVGVLLVLVLTGRILALMVRRYKTTRELDPSPYSSSISNDDGIISNTENLAASASPASSATGIPTTLSGLPSSSSSSETVTTASSAETTTSELDHIYDEICDDSGVYVLNPHLVIVE